MNVVIYVRVSSLDQVEGTSLVSQELACREYANKLKLTVLRVFVEQGESAKFANRTQLLQLLDYCKDKRNKIRSLVVWKLDRFSRNVEDHFAIKGKLRSYGVSLVSVTEPIAGDPNGKLMETMLAAIAAFDNDIKAMRTVQGLQQKLREGLFPWKAPLGYLPTKTGKKTAPDIPDPQRFEGLKKAWGLFATGAYSKADIARVLQNCGVLAYRGKAVSAQAIDHILQNPYYAGVLVDPWTGAEYLGRHLPMVSREVFAKVQQIVAGRSHAQPHCKISDSFPLRGLVRCPACHHQLTASFARGRKKRYPYYSCFRNGCSKQRKSYAAEIVHNEFLGFIRELDVPRPLALSTLDEIRGMVSIEHETARISAKTLKDSYLRLDNRLNQLVAMRTNVLITDEEFLHQRDCLRQERYVLDAKAAELPDRWLARTDETLLVNWIQKVDLLWKRTASVHRRRFEQILLPAGYLLGKVRTASRGPLFNVFPMSNGDESNSVPHVKSDPNRLRADITEFLTIIRSMEEPVKQDSDAA